MRSRLAMLTTNLARGGAETQVFHLARELARRGWRAAVISMVAPTAYAAELEAEGVQVYSLGMRAGIPDPRALARLLVILNRFRPRLLHTHMIHANLLGRVARLLCPVEVVVSTIHSVAETGTHSKRLWLRDLSYRLTDPLADLVVAVSRAAAERHATSGATSRGRLRVIPNGVDTTVFRPDPERRARTRRDLGLNGEFAWLAAGRLMWKKDYPTMLRAFAGQPGVLLIAGEGPDEAALRAQARELAVDVRFLGRREDIPALMNAADGLVLSSVIEGLPLVLLEAAASGLPAVTTDAGGSAEAIEEGRTGFVVPASDAAALYQAMARLSGMDAAAREGLSRAARALAERCFDLGAVAGEWERTYGELLQAQEAAWT